MVWFRRGSIQRRGKLFLYISGWITSLYTYLEKSMIMDLWDGLINYIYRKEDICDTMSLFQTLLAKFHSKKIFDFIKTESSRNLDYGFRKNICFNNSTMFVSSKGIFRAQQLKVRNNIIFHWEDCLPVPSTRSTEKTSTTSIIKFFNNERIRQTANLISMCFGHFRG